MEREIRLNELSYGEKGLVTKVHTQSGDRRRLLDLGIVKNTMIEALQKSPSGDPTAYNIRGAVIALRSYEAEQIAVCPIRTAKGR